MSSQAYFDQVAPQWDQMRRSFFSSAVREKAYAVAGLQPGRIAADIGAGTGFITEGLLQRGSQVIAVDQSPAMIAEMERNFARYPGVSYRLGQAEHLPLADQAVDYVFANMYLHHVAEPLVAIREMVRILKPGGRLVITDLDKHQYEFLRTEQHDRWLGFERADVRGWFEQAGLVGVMVDCVGEDCTAPAQNGAESARVSIFVAAGDKPVG